MRISTMMVWHQAPAAHVMDYPLHGVNMAVTVEGAMIVDETPVQVKATIVVTVVITIFMTLAFVAGTGNRGGDGNKS